MKGLNAQAAAVADLGLGLARLVQLDRAVHQAGLQNLSMGSTTP